VSTIPWQTKQYIIITNIMILYMSQRNDDTTVIFSLDPNDDENIKYFFDLNVLIFFDIIFLIIFFLYTSDTHRTCYVENPRIRHRYTWLCRRIEYYLKTRVFLPILWGSTIIRIPSFILQRAAPNRRPATTVLLLPPIQ